MPGELRETSTFLGKEGKGVVRLVEGMPNASSTGLSGERSWHRATGNADNNGLDEEMLRATM
jgi:hypothetical protein